MISLIKISIGRKTSSAILIVNCFEYHGGRVEDGVCVCVWGGGGGNNIFSRVGWVIGRFYVQICDILFILLY